MMQQMQQSKQSFETHRTPQVSTQLFAQKSANAPEKKFAAGGISATIWANEKEVNGAPVSIKTVSLTRTYKDKDGQWKHSASMRINDIPKAQLVLEKAFEYLTLKDNSSNSAEELI